MGGIGKGYAVDRALEILRSDGIRHTVVNGGGSTIAGIGNPPGQAGWPVRLGASITGRTTLLLRDQSISTSQQTMSTLAAEPASAGEIIEWHVREHAAVMRPQLFLMPYRTDGASR